MSIKRTPLAFERDFTQVPNSWVRDPSLSRRARGLLAELMSHRAGWHVTIASLVASGPEGRDAIRSAVQELASAGYLRRVQTHGEQGRFNEIDYELCEPPAGKSTVVGKSTDDGFPDNGGFTDVGSADVGSPPTKNTSSQENQVPENKSRTRASRIPANWSPSSELLAWASSTVPLIDTLAETPNFIDYWTAQAGARGLKADWDATWRTWMRRQQPNNSPGRKLTRTEENLLTVQQYAQKEIA